MNLIHANTNTDIKFMTLIIFRFCVLCGYEVDGLNGLTVKQYDKLESNGF